MLYTFVASAVLFNPAVGLLRGRAKPHRELHSGRDAARYKPDRASGPMQGLMRWAWSARAERKLPKRDQQAHPHGVLRGGDLLRPQTEQGGSTYPRRSRRVLPDTGTRPQIPRLLDGGEQRGSCPGTRSRGQVDTFNGERISSLNA